MAQAQSLQGVEGPGQLQRDRAPVPVHVGRACAELQVVLDQAKVIHRPRLLSDNGSSYISSDLAKWLNSQSMQHVCGAPYHPMTQGKIERWHQTLKNRILLEHYYLPVDLERRVAAFVAQYNYARHHESLANLTPADVYFGRAETLLLERERIKRQTIANRRLQHQLHAA